MGKQGKRKLESSRFRSLWYWVWWQLGLDGRNAGARQPTHMDWILQILPRDGRQMNCQGLYDGVEATAETKAAQDLNAAVSQDETISPALGSRIGGTHFNRRVGFPEFLY